MGASRRPFAGVDKYKPDGPQGGAADQQYCRLPEKRRQACARSGNRPETLRAAGWHDHLHSSSSPRWRPHRARRSAVRRPALGVKDLRWFPSASFPCHTPVIELMEAGVVHHIEGSMNGPLGDYCSHGKMRGLGVLRSHGGRWQAIQDGEVHIDIAVIAAPTADCFGNADGSHGKSACGSLGFALADSVYADRVIVVTDNLVPFPCVPCADPGQQCRFRRRSAFHWRSVEDRFRHDPDHAFTGPVADRRDDCPSAARCRNHARRLFLPGRGRRHRAGVRRLSEPATCAKRE